MKFNTTTVNDEIEFGELFKTILMNVHSHHDAKRSLKCAVMYTVLTNP